MEGLGTPRMGTSGCSFGLWVSGSGYEMYILASLGFVDRIFSGSQSLMKMLAFRVQGHLRLLTGFLGAYRGFEISRLRKIF